MPIEAGIVQHGLFQHLPLGAGFAEAGSDDYRCLDAMLAASLDDVGHGLRRRGDHCQFNRLADFANRGVGLAALNFRAFRVDRVKPALVAAFDHVLEYDLADRIDTLAGAEDRDGFWREKGIEVVLAHDFAIQM